jgi:hypothetical protein
MARAQACRSWCGYDVQQYSDTGSSIGTPDQTRYIMHGEALVRRNGQRPRLRRRRRLSGYPTGYPRETFHCRKEALFSAFARQPLSPEAFAIGVKCLLRGLMVTHGLFSLNFARSIAGFALFGGEDAG